MERIFLDSSSDTLSTEEGTDTNNLQTLVSESTAVFDVLTEFFYHAEPVVQRAALEVYIRRAYVAYSLDKIDFSTSSNSSSMIVFTFSLPTTSPDDQDSQNPSRQAARLTTSVKGGLVRKVYSITDMQAFEQQAIQDAAAARAPVSRMGVMASFSSIDHLKAEFDSICSSFQEHVQKAKEPVNVLMLSLRYTEDNFESKDDAAILAVLGALVAGYSSKLREMQIRRVTFIVVSNGEFPKYFTFREKNDFAEDSIYRHVDPALAYKLEMFRLSNYDVEHCPVQNNRLHLYYAKGRMTEGQKFQDNRFFMRAIMRYPDLPAGMDYTEFLQTAGESQLVEALDEIEVLYNDPKYAKSDCNHLYINSVPIVSLEPEVFAKQLNVIVLRYAKRLRKLRVTEAEIRMTFKTSATSELMPVRFVVSCESGYYIHLHMYQEVPNENGGDPTYRSFGTGNEGPLHGKSCYEAYAVKDVTQTKRYAAQKLGSTYAYDYIDLLREVVARRWESAKQKFAGTSVPTSQLQATELVLNEKDQLVESVGAPGENKVGMIAWRVVMRTPEAPQGRELILITNDITHVIGSFGPREDMVFLRASQLARKEKIPRIYVSVNSGARIGLASEVMSNYRIAWVDESKPWKGFKYLYLMPEQYRLLSDQQAVKAEAIEDEGESRYKITDIIGVQDGLGVECLKASGAIAGETSMAYEETFTCTLVSTRSVGIGAYLVRLGQRTIQNENSHIILTGAGALNKVLGKDVYTSNQQLGGPQIMYNNGVSHMTVRDDFVGMQAMVQWLSYVPLQKQQFSLTPPSFIMGMNNKVFAADPVDRDVTFLPPAELYDPRILITGCQGPDKWESGLFDRGSFTELLGGWAKTVISGRARLGGLPVGVVAVETKAIELLVPADPANVDTEAQVFNQAGQVWYPDSAFKTAQAIKDIDRENLPLFILANWRGFSGGMHDMYEEVLKFGAMIVDNLNTFKQPVFIYIPPGCELRGGAWVVVDPSINPNMMEMYADELSRGGVLEAEGIVEIKYRKKAIVQTMERLDAEYGDLCGKIRGAATVEEAAELKKARDTRYDKLAPMYHQVAVEFAALHDTPGRMKQKNVISDILTWKSSRRFFYWRLRRRLGLEKIRSEIYEANPDTPFAQSTFMMRRWFFESRGSKQAYLWDDNAAVVEWLTSQMNEDGSVRKDSAIAQNLTQLQQEHSVDTVKAVAQKSDSDTAFNCALALLEHLSPVQRQELVESLKTMDNSSSA